ncbi:serine/threonine-protein kinase STY8 [Pelomyxa schiedti]|nr:serine/threonine-protein kinase STY8 [Pelomyxa schiedti]
MGASASARAKAKSKAFEAAEHGNIEELKRLLKHFPDLVRQDPGEPWSLLHVAAWGPHPQALELLLMHGREFVDANCRNTNTQETPLHYASKGGNAQSVALLIQAGADVAAVNKNGFTAMHFACAQGHLEVVKQLKQYGADPTVPNKSGESPLDLTENPAILSLFTSPVVRGSTHLSKHPSFIRAQSISFVFNFIAREEVTFGDVIGAGATGRVSKGSWRGTTVAVKQFYPMTTTEFETEIKGIASLGNHPNIVTTYGVIIPETEGDPFCIVSEFVQYGSLASLLDARRLTPAEIAHAAICMAKGIAFLHSKGVIHRDIKPQNVLVSELDPLLVKLCDFGLAKTISSSARQKMTIATGTPTYMAPEVVTGTDYDLKADVYSFGVMLYQMVTGQTPFQEVTNHFEVTRKLLNGERPEIVAPPGVCGKAIELIPKCWAPDPATRPTFEVILHQLTKCFPLVHTPDEED